MHQIVKLAAMVAFSSAVVLIPAGVFAQDSELPAGEQTASPSPDEPMKQIRLQVKSALTASVAAYQALMTESVTQPAREIVASADESKLDVPEDDQEAVELAAEVRELGLR